MNFESFKSEYLTGDVLHYTHKVPKTVDVSVCVSAFQHSDFIDECLDSILAQRTKYKYEILLGEDDSSDGTREICIRYATEYPDKVRLILHDRTNNIEIDGYHTGRFNLLYNLFNAQGRYVAFCEGDDYWVDPLKLQRQADSLESDSRAFGAFHPVITLFEEDSNQRRKLQMLPSGKQCYFIQDLLKPWIIGTSSLMLRKERLHIPDWFTQIPTGDIAMVLLGIGEDYLLFDSRHASIYRKHEEGVSMKHVGIKKVMDMADLYKRVNSFYGFKHRELISKGLEMEIDKHVFPHKRAEIRNAIKEGQDLSVGEHVGAILKKIYRKLGLN